jgi:hypothetical protein
MPCYRNLFHVRSGRALIELIAECWAPSLALRRQRRRLHDTLYCDVIVRFGDPCWWTQWRFQEGPSARFR